MTRAAERYVCQDCGASFRRWVGRCEACGAWNTVIEEAPALAVPKGLGAGRGRALDPVPLDDDTADAGRKATGIAELDRVCGGGLVPGSALLIGGDPGIGKSTLLLQAAASLAERGLRCLYVSGEEATAQIGLRARRLGLAGAPVTVAAATSVRDVLTGLDGPDAPRVLVVDSIQTMFLDNLESAPGTVAQVRASAQELIRAAKRSGCTLLLVGHVTKDGQIAGPRVLEHMVDTVLYFEGDRGHQFRILRAVKNRYGPTNEIGVFEMTDRGLAEVGNPSALLLGDRRGGISGSAVFAGMEGSRPLLVEIQALVARSPLATPRRAVVGWDNARLAMVLAVLDSRCGLALGAHDVYLNVAGGLRVGEPAADLAAAAALISSAHHWPLPAETVVFGEIGLSGEVRPVGRAEARLNEAAKLGFPHAILPAGQKGRPSGIECAEIGSLDQLVDLLPPGSEAAARIEADRDDG